MLFYRAHKPVMHDGFPSVIEDKTLNLARAWHQLDMSIWNSSWASASACCLIKATLYRDFAISPPVAYARYTLIVASWASSAA
jgi:hypothetical protein